MHTGDDLDNRLAQIEREYQRLQNRITLIIFILLGALIVPLWHFSSSPSAVVLEETAEVTELREHAFNNLNPARFDL